MNDRYRTRVLIAEDDYLVCEDIERAVQAMGHDVVATAANGEKAVELTYELHPDIVLMDIQMPKLDGLSAAEYLDKAGVMFEEMDLEWDLEQLEKVQRS